MKNLENDLFIMTDQEIMTDWLIVQDKLFEMDYRDKKFIEIDDGFDLDFN